MSKEDVHQYARGQEIKSQIQNQKNSLEKILASIIKTNSDNKVKLTHEDDLVTEIDDKKEASIENRSSSEYDILKEIGDGQGAITLMERTSAR